MLHYGCYIKKLDDIESIGETLTNLKEIADEVIKFIIILVCQLRHI